MNSQPIVIETTYNAPIDKVWKALTDKEQMKAWYFDIPDFKPEPGFEFEFAGKGKEGEDYLHKCRVLAVEPPTTFSHSWRYEGYEGDSAVTFELEAAGNQTHLKLTHSGLETFPDTAAFARENFVAGWTYITGTALKQFVAQ